MTEAKLTWSIWQALLNAFAWAFTRHGFHRFAEWITAMALNVEEHTITQSVLALEQPAAWKALESFAEYGSWHQDRVTWALTHLIATAPGRIWHGYQVSAVDDTKVHRSSPHVWGTCTFHEYTARCPNRAPTVRAHNWVVLGALAPRTREARAVPADLRPALLPAVAVAGRARRHRGVPDQVRTGRRVAPRAGPHHQGQALGRRRRRLRLGECGPAAGPARRRHAPGRLPHPLAARRPAVRLAPALGAAPRGEAGTEAQVGSATGPAAPGGRWKAKWQVGTAFVYGRQRTIRWKEIVCLWRVLGWEVPVKAIVASVEGYKKRFTLVTSAVDLTGLQMVELFTARFRQEDGFRDLKQRLGWEECRAWTANPIERTSQAQWVTMSLLRLLQFRLEACGEVGWWFRPPWNKKKDRPSVLDAERLMRRHREKIQRLLSKWAGDEGKTEEAAA